MWSAFITSSLLYNLRIEAKICIFQLFKTRVLHFWYRGYQFYNFYYFGLWSCLFHVLLTIAVLAYTKWCLCINTKRFHSFIIAIFYFETCWQLNILLSILSYTSIPHFIRVKLPPDFAFFFMKSSNLIEYRVIYL